MLCVPNLHIIAASTSGHTDYVVAEVVVFLKNKAPKVTVNVQRAEQASSEDLLKGDVLLLASGTWNTGGNEGQLNPHMHAFVRERAADAKLKGKKVVVIGLGDERYRYTARAKDLLEEFVTSHGGTLLLPSLKIVNEPYGQEESIKKWAQTFAQKL